MAFDNTKHDVELNGVGYRIGSYNKSVANAFVPRIGSGDQDESDFSLLRAKTLDGFAGGQLQRFWQDDTSFYGSEGLFPIFDDGVLYPVNAPVSDDGLISSDKAEMVTYCVTKDYTFIAYRKYAGTNHLVRLDRDGNTTTITLPSSISSSIHKIASVVTWNYKLWISTTDGTNLAYMTLTSTSMTSVPGSGGCVGGLLVVYKGQLYGMDGSSGSSVSVVLYRHTGGTTSRSHVTVGDTGIRYSNDLEANLFVFNGRIMLARPDGLWTYDGFSLLPIEASEQNYNELNYRFPVVLRGYLYFFMEDGWYRYNGSLIEKVYDRQEIGYPVDVQVGKNRIWMLYRNSSVAGSSRFDRLMGYDYSSGNNVDGRVAVYDGKGMFTYARTSTFVKNPGSDDFADQGAVDSLFWFNDTLYILNYYEKTIGNQFYTIDTDEKSATGQKDWRLITSIFDGDFPMVDKSLENFEVVLDGDTDSIAGSDTIELSVRNDEFDQSGTWSPVGDFLDEDDLKLDMHINEPAGYGFRQNQCLLEGTTTAGYGMRQFVQRFLIAPEIRWEWTITLLAYGDKDTEPLKLIDGTEEPLIRTQYLRGNIYSSAVSEFPLLFVDIDQIHIDSTGFLAADTSIPLRSADLLRNNGGEYRPKLGSGGFLVVEDEVIHWDSISGDSVVAKKRGALNTTAADHAADTKAHLAYRVLCEIKNERYVPAQPGEVAFDRSRATEITVVLREV